MFARGLGSSATGLAATENGFVYRSTEAVSRSNPREALARLHGRPWPASASCSFCACTVAVAVTVAVRGTGTGGPPRRGHSPLGHSHFKLYGGFKAEACQGQLFQNARGAVQNSLQSVHRAASRRLCWKPHHHDGPWHLLRSRGIGCSDRNVCERPCPRLLDQYMAPWCSPTGALGLGLRRRRRVFCFGNSKRDNSLVAKPRLA